MAREPMPEQPLDANRLRDVAAELHAQAWRLGTIVASVRGNAVTLRYCFYATRQPDWKILRIESALHAEVPSLTPIVIAADWFEREIEDLFSVTFSQHPRLGDFVLHDDMWAEDVGVMRRSADAGSAATKRASRRWSPRRVLNEEGAFVMPVGPIFSGEAESALFLLETVGEDVVRSVPRLFYKYRAIEKLAEGKTFADGLLLAERCNGTSAIGNAWSYARAVESACRVEVPARAQTLRTFFAELERVRHHVTAIREICSSTALLVATSQLLWLEEQMLRICGELSGHRYLFGLLAIGGMTRDVDDAALERAVQLIEQVCIELQQQGHALAETSSFLDRIERVGIIDTGKARAFEVVGPLARASGVSADMRRIAPYGVYPSLAFDVPSEDEGDGYARLRVLFAEVEQSVRLLRQLVRDIPAGPLASPFAPASGSSLGWTEASRGASITWVETGDDGTLARLRLTPPSFRNWHGFHVATEEFAFQDFPIIMATLDLSVAENDR